MKTKTKQNLIKQDGTLEELMKAQIKAKIASLAPVKRRRKRRNKGKFPPVAMPMPQRSFALTGFNKDEGVDRIFHIPDISKDIVDKQILIDIPVLPTLGSRLGIIASAWQRIVYKKLEFSITPKTSTAVSGGYIAAFIPDVTDVLTGTSPDFALDKLSSQPSAVEAKWWESSTVRVPSLPDLFYTSPSPESPRFSSPGRFVLIVDGAASQAGSLTIKMHWSVLLSEPSLEGNNAPADQKEFVIKDGLWMQAKAGGIFVNTSSDNTKKVLNSNVLLVLPDAKENQIYRMATTASYLRCADTVTLDNIWLRSFWYFIIVKTSSGGLQMYPYTPENKEILKDNSAGDTEVLPAGHEVLLESTAQVDFPRGSEFICASDRKSLLHHFYQMSLSLNKNRQQYQTASSNKCLTFLPLYSKFISSLKREDSFGEEKALRWRAGSQASFLDWETLPEKLTRLEVSDVQSLK
ncbi:coat protein [Egaro virus]|uniref:coat protein n=1 Tax=Egaro virus TaxID=1888318 RepID=UPI00083EF682|nr:coat protein [Egaro virus]AOC55065.1 coat protein [Egaro virus]